MRFLATLILLATIFSGSHSLAYEVSTGEGTSMRIELKQQQNIARVVDRAMADPVEFIRLQSRIGNHLGRAQREEILTLIEEGWHSQAREIITEIASVSVTTGYLNADTSEIRRWVLVNNPDIDISFVSDDFQGVNVIADSGQFFIESELVLFAKSPVTAFVVGVEIFDIWGDHLRSLSFERLQDTPEGSLTISMQASLPSQSEAAKVFHSVYYIKSVRFNDGRIARDDRSDVFNFLSEAGFSFRLKD